jgi:hypothetical protein
LVGFTDEDDVASPKFQVYEDNVASEAVKFMGRPGSDGFGVNDAIAIVGKGLTDIAFVAVAEHVPVVPVIV